MPEQPAKPQEIKVNFPEALKGGVYSNSMVVNHTKEEFIMDFIVITPPMGTTRLLALARGRCGRGVFTVYSRYGPGGDIASKKQHVSRCGARSYASEIGQLEKWNSMHF